jgi:predicted Zn finger-like uncharacterized protein
MDVRCEKCQTEYELDEARLKPGGVTVKCTNCGHMFRVRKRATTNVGPAIAPDPQRPRTPSIPKTPPPERGLFDDEARDEAPTTVERQWLIRLENGEQKSCRELATLQQWIISGIVTRESLISRTGKTWKRLGDIPDLGQYFTIADEARASRERARPTSRPAPAAKDASSTLPGYGAAAQAAGGTILPDDEDDVEGVTTRAQQRLAATTPPPVPRGAVRTPPMGSLAAAPTILASVPSGPTASSTSATEPVIGPPRAASGPVRRPATTPPPPPPRKPAVPSGQSGPIMGAQPPAIPQGNRATAAWAAEGLKGEPTPTQSGPFVGKLSAVPDEPAFAGRVRIAPGDESTFDTGKVRVVDDDDGVLPANRGSRAGMWVLLIALVVMAGGGAAIYFLVIRDHASQPVAVVKDAAVVAEVASDAAAADAPAADATGEPTALDAARGELATDLEPRLRAAIQSLEGKPEAQALRAHLIAQLAQDLTDRASLGGDKASADAARKEAKQLVLDAATAAQRALKAAGDDPGANIAMAEVLRLQGKPAKDIQRYLDMARTSSSAKADKSWARELALAEAQVLARDGKLDDARAAFAAIDSGEGKLETSNDVRARFHTALVLAQQGKAADARPLVDQILAAQAEHAGAKALAARLETQVATTDPLPPEVGAKDPKPTPARDPKDPKPAPIAPEPGGESYDKLLKRANAVADSSCAQAMELYARALEQKPNGVEALTGMGYCHIDAKQFASAFSKFRAALAVSSRYEPALRGVAEAYQQQGRKEQAIEAYKAYLEVYPDNAAAKRQLDRLGGGASDLPAPAPPPAPTTPPPPAPTGEPAGAGSGSE